MFLLRWTEQSQDFYRAIRIRAEKSLDSRAQKGKKKSSKIESLFKQVHKTLQLLQSNPKHPGLRTHEYRSLEHPYDPHGKVFEAYTQNKTPGAYRVFWCYGPGKGELTILAITPHP